MWSFANFASRFIINIFNTICYTTASIKRSVVHTVSIVLAKSVAVRLYRKYLTLQKLRIFHLTGCFSIRCEALWWVILYCTLDEFVRVFINHPLWHLGDYRHHFSARYILFHWLVFRFCVCALHFFSLPPTFHFSLQWPVFLLTYLSAAQTLDSIVTHSEAAQLLFQMSSQ